MIRVHLVTTLEDRDSGITSAAADFDRMAASAALDGCGRHELVGDHRDADLVLFVGANDRYQRDVLAHPIYRSARERCFVYECTDHPFPAVAGVYAALDRRWHDRSRHRAGFYLRPAEASWLDRIEANPRPDYLFSFVGAVCNCAVRRDVMRLRLERSLLRDTSLAPGRGYGQSEAVYRDYRDGYAETLERSAFVLCPRGVGPASLRLFEAMRAGRVPVVIADDWYVPEGPDWPAFSLRIPERDVHRIPEILVDFEASATARGQRARAAWHEWFSLDGAFHRIVDSCLEIRHGRSVPERFARWKVLTHLVRPWELRYGWPRLLARKAMRLD